MAEWFELKSAVTTQDKRLPCPNVAHQIPHLAHPWAALPGRQILDPFHCEGYALQLNWPYLGSDDPYDIEYRQRMRMHFLYGATISPAPRLTVITT